MNHNLIVFISQVTENGELSIGEEAGEKNRRGERNDRREERETKRIERQRGIQKERMNAVCS